MSRHVTLSRHAVNRNHQIISDDLLTDPHEKYSQTSNFPLDWGSCLVKTEKPRRSKSLEQGFYGTEN